jgi:molecular chaperone GrpE
MEHQNNEVVPDKGSSAPEQPESLSLAAEAEEQKKRYDDLNDRFLRLAADLDNFRKRTAREQEGLAQRANERFAVDILEVADNIERALRADNDHLREGMEQIRRLLMEILARYGITPVEALKTSFNPAEHEAVVHVPSAEAEGTIVDVVSRGYRMHGKIIRYAKVAVSKGNEEKQTEE